MNYVCVTYAQRIGPATYVLRILSASVKKRSILAFEEYEVRIKEYELCMLTYVQSTCDVPYVS